MATTDEKEVDDYQVMIDGLLSASLTATKASNVLYARNDHGYLASYPSWREQNDAVAKRLTDLLQVVQKQVGGVDYGIQGDSFGDVDADIDDYYTNISETIEFLLEQVETNLDSGSKKSTIQVNENYGKNYLLEMLKAPKPQDSPNFKYHANRLPDNSRESLFVHMPWDRRDVFTEETKVNCHPFDKEIAKVQYSESHLIAPKRPRPCPRPLVPQDMKQGWTMVEDEASLEELSRDLALGCSELAIDLEHHSFRTFQGLTCLMQLTTPRHDYIIDCLSPKIRPFLGVTLGPVFADAAVVKVLHGANSDILWLQRDFGLYIVNLFDTGQAARFLGYPSASLAYLLEKHAQITDISDMKRKYQMSDWRVRPLTSGQLLYARSDTHYLLHIYDILKCELALKGKDTIRDVLKGCESICRLCYRKESFDPTSLVKATIKFNTCKEEMSPAAHHRAALLWDWRDAIARQEDESVGFVMSNHLLFKLSQNCPRTTEEVIATCKGGIHGDQAPPLVMKHVEDILKILMTEPPLERTTSDRKLSSLSSSGFSSFTFTPQVTVFDSALEVEKMDTYISEEQISQPRNLTGSEVYQAAGWINPFAPNSHTEDEAANMAEKIRRDLSQRPFLPLVKKIFKEEKEAATKKIEFSSQISPQTDGGSAETNATGNSVMTDATEPESHLNGIPRSMSEIYKISNRNRHRNKEKKKLRETPVSTIPADSSTQPFDYFSSSSSSSSKKQKGSEGEESARVLEQVGWTRKGEAKKSAQIAEKGVMGHYDSLLNASTSAQSANPYLMNDMS